MVLNLDMMFFVINVLRLLPESLAKAADDLKTSGLPIRTTEWRKLDNSPQQLFQNRYQI